MYNFQPRLSPRRHSVRFGPSCVPPSPSDRPSRLQLLPNANFPDLNLSQVLIYFEFSMVMDSCLGNPLLLSSMANILLVWAHTVACIWFHFIAVFDFILIFHAFLNIFSVLGVLRYFQSPISVTFSWLWCKCLQVHIFKKKLKKNIFINSVFQSIY